MFFCINTANAEFPVTLEIPHWQYLGVCGRLYQIPGWKDIVEKLIKNKPDENGNLLVVKDWWAMLQNELSKNGK